VVIPHDDLFHFTFQHVHHVVPWLRCVLPAPITAAIDWSRLVPAPERLHGLAQRLSVADLVFRARRASNGAPVWIVVEHKANEELGVERQMLRYAVHLGDRVRGVRKLVPVVAVLLNHGDRPFAVTVPPADDPFAVLQPRQPIVVDDIAIATEVALCARSMTPLGVLVLLCLRFLRRMSGDEALRAFDRWGDLLRAVDRDEGPPIGRDAVAKIAGYALAVVEVSPHDLRATFERLLQRPEETIMSTLERTYQKGRAEGHAEGRAATILRQLQKRFGPLPAGTDGRVRRGSEAELTRWTDRILDARTLADVFAD
jgi:hypothetical protein